MNTVAIILEGELTLSTRHLILGVIKIQYIDHLIGDGLDGWPWIQYFKKSQTVGFVTQMRRAARRCCMIGGYIILYFVIYVYRIEFLSFFVDEPLIII